MRSLFDASALVAALVDQLGHHEAAILPLHRFTCGQHQKFCSAQTLVDCFATLIDLV